MKFIYPSLFRKLLVDPLLLSIIFIISCAFLNYHAKANDGVPVSLVGAHHLGPDYAVYRFYINKVIGDRVGEGGGGGSMVCCISLPRKWHPALTADVRWKVVRIVRSRNPNTPDTAETIGIYQAQVPIDKYIEPGDFHVHFFPKGRVRIAVSTTELDREMHPIHTEDREAPKHASNGKAVKALFTAEEIAERKKAATNDRNNFGSWR